MQTHLQPAFAACRHIYSRHLLRVDTSTAGIRCVQTHLQPAFAACRHIYSRHSLRVDTSTAGIRQQAGIHYLSIITDTGKKKTRHHQVQCCGATATRNRGYSLTTRIRGSLFCVQRLHPTVVALEVFLHKWVCCYRVYKYVIRTQGACIVCLRARTNSHVFTTGLSQPHRVLNNIFFFSLLFFQQILRLRKNLPE